MRRLLYNGSMKLARLAALAWLRWIRLALFTVATLLWIASHGCMVAFLGSEFPPEKFWVLYGKPACQYHILVFIAIGLFLAGCLIYAMEAFRRNSGWRRRGAMAGIVIFMLGSLVAFAFAIRSAEKLSASGKVWQCLGNNACPGDSEGYLRITHDEGEEINHKEHKNHVDQNAALEPLLYRGKGYVVLYLNVMEVATGKSFFILIPNSNYIPPLDCLVAESPHFTTLSELNNYVWSVDRKFIIEELEHSFYDSKKYLPMRQFHEMELELKLNLQRPMWPHKESARSAPKGVQWFHDKG